LWDEYNNEFLKRAFNYGENEYRQSYNNAGATIGLTEVFTGTNIHHPAYRWKTCKKRCEAKLDELESLLSKAELIPTQDEPSITRSFENYGISNKSKPTVFLIHGHDEEMKRNVQLFLTRGDIQDIVLHEQPDKNRTVIEKLIEEGSKADYVIALLSPDDLQDDGTFRARQNVLLEIGYFIGKLGRERVRLLRRSDTAIPSDLVGILYENYDSDGAWKIKMAREIEASGIPINIKKIVSKF
jgi:predicted nucleotide-binding protein